MPTYTESLQGYQPSGTVPSGTNGPDGQSWGSGQQLNQQSAQEFANRLGATLVPITYDSGPFSLQNPQYQLDFGTGNLHDASLLYQSYLRAPAFFNDSLQAELRNDAAGSSGPSGGAGGYRPPSPGPSASPGPSSGPGMPPMRPPTGGAQPPVWTPPAQPGRPNTPPVTIYPGSGVLSGGGYTAPGLYTGDFPPPYALLDPTSMPPRSKAPQGLLANPFARRQGGLL